MKTPVSPKVTASALAAVLAGLVLANINLVTPDLFDGLGKWSGLAYSLAIALISTVAGWLKSDPLREAGLAAQAPAEVPAAPAETPAVVAPAAPATVFPAAAVASAVAEPAIVTPVYEAPAVVA